MTLPELQVCLCRIGAKPSLPNGKLTVWAPPGALTPEIKEALREHKAALVEMLAGPPDDSPAPAVAGPPVPPEWHGAPLDGHWHDAIAWWPVEWRQKWGDRAEVHQAAGIDWCLAEYWAWRETLRELDQAEARGEWIEYREPAPELSDADAVAAIDRAFDPHWWTRPPETESWHGDLGPRDVRRGDRWLPWHGKSEN
jgi:hypothetical protein